jgi:hypothetical protein
MVFLFLCFIGGRMNKILAILIYLLTTIILMPIASIIAILCDIVEYFKLVVERMPR